MTLVTRAGAIADPAGKAGVAQPGDRRPSTWARRRARRSRSRTRSATSAPRSPAAPAASTRGAQLRGAVAQPVGRRSSIVADVVQNPTFPEEEVDAREEAAARRAARRPNERQRAGGPRAPILAFGADHPYGRPAQGLPRACESDHARRPRRVPPRRAGSRVARRSSSSAASRSREATELARTALRRLDRRRGAPAITVRRAGGRRRRTIYLVDRPDAAQTVVAQLPARRRARTLADYYRAAARRRGLGRRRLRHAAEPQPARGQGLFLRRVLEPQPACATAGTGARRGGVQTDKTKESVAEFDKELKALARRARRSRRRVQRRPRRDSARLCAAVRVACARIAGQIANLWALGLPMSELQREYDATARSTLDALLAAAKKYVQPGASSIAPASATARRSSRASRR